MLFPILFTILAFPVFAETVTIHSLGDDFIKLNDGRVAFTKVSEDFYPGQTIELEMNQEHEVLSTSPSFLSPFLPPVSHFPSSAKQLFKPSVLKNYSLATDLLLTFNAKDIEGSQCYDRAHVWSYEASKKQNTELGKAWLFFADHYIEKYKFKWWFHVAPVAQVMMKGVQEERILDRKFATFPMQFKIWTDKFMENKVACREIKSYSEYSKHPGEDDCYMLKSTPYFWQPKDLEEFDKSGNEKRDYIPWEIAYAYRYGFGLLISYRPINQ